MWYFAWLLGLPLGLWLFRLLLLGLWLGLWLWYGVLCRPARLLVGRFHWCSFNCGWAKIRG